MAHRVASLLERQGIPFGVMRERDWRNLFIGGATPESAAERAALEFHARAPRSVASHADDAGAEAERGVTASMPTYLPLR